VLAGQKFTASDLLRGRTQGEIGALQWLLREAGGMTARAWKLTAMGMVTLLVPAAGVRRVSALAGRGRDDDESGSGSMRVLVACEFSGVVREAFRRRGHDAWSCDIQPAEYHSEFHIEADILNVLGSESSPLGALGQC